MTKRVTFADLEKLLLELGFVRQAVQGSHQVFQYQGQDVLVVLPGYEIQDWVLPTHLVSVRRILAENDLMSLSKFESWIASAKIPA
jgi:predicted RNA binding protein YcfA (HicA-like mRNA interferase family)